MIRRKWRHREYAASYAQYGDAKTNYYGEINGKMDRRLKPIPLVSGQAVRLIDNEYILQKGRLFRFDEEEKKDLDITDKAPEVLQRLTAWEDAWRATVKEDQAVYTVKRR